MSYNELFTMLHTKHQAFQVSDTLPKSVGQNYLWRKSCGEKCGELWGKCGERGKWPVCGMRWAVGSAKRGVDGNQRAVGSRQYPVGTGQ